MKCPQCNTSLKEGQKFCNKCGAKVESRGAALPPELLAAVDIHEKRIAQDTLNPKLYMDLGDLYSDHGHFENALIQYQKAASIDKTLAEAHMKSGSIYERMKQFEKAVSAFENVLKLSPESTAAERGLMSALVGSKKLIEAEALGRKIVQKDPSNVELHKLLRDIYIQQGNDAKAIEELKTLISLQPGESVNCSILGNLYRKKGEKENALTQYLAVLGINGKNKDALFHAGVLSYEKGDFAQAVQYLEKLAGFDEVSNSVLAYLAIARSEQGDLAGAQDKLKRFDGKQKSSFSKDDLQLVSLAYYKVARRLIDANKKNDAAHLLNRSLDIYRNEDAAKARASLYAQDAEEALSRNSFGDAEAFFRSALDLVPDDKTYQDRVQHSQKLAQGKKKKIVFSIFIPALVIALALIGFIVWKHYDSGILTVTYQSYEVQRIEVDGKEYTGGPLTLSKGEHTVIAKGWPSYKDATQKIILAGGEKKELTISLEMEKQPESANTEEQLMNAGEYEGTVASPLGPCQRDPGDKTYCGMVYLKLDSGKIISSPLHLYTTILRNGKVVYNGPDTNKSMVDQANNSDKTFREVLKPETRVAVTVNCGQDSGCVINMIKSGDNSPANKVTNEQRRAEEQRVLEEQRRVEEQRVLEERRRAEEQRALEERRRAEEQRALEERKRAEVSPQPSENQIKSMVEEFYRLRSEWKGVFVIDGIERVRLEPQSDRSFIAHVRYKYRPVTGSYRRDTGYDQRTFLFEYTGSTWEVRRMGGNMSARF